MIPEFPAPTTFDRTVVRVGCSLAYEVSEPTPILLLIRPRVSQGQVALQERFVFGNGQPVDQFVDANHNLVYQSTLLPGINEVHHDALFLVAKNADDEQLSTDVISPREMSPEVLRYTLPSRYCDSDKLGYFAQQHFGHLWGTPGQVDAICNWTRDNIEYRFGSGDATLSAWDVIQRGYGVCRDLAHVMIALCRAMNLPARYVAGHIPYMGVSEGDIGVDFQAYCEVYLGGHWHMYDPHFYQVHHGRIKIAHGMDAVDAAFATIFGDAAQIVFRVWAYQVGDAHAQIAAPMAPEWQHAVAAAQIGQTG